MTKLGNTYVKKATGYAPAAVDASEFVGAVQAENWDATLYVVAVGAVATSLDVTVQDSLDGTTYADVSGKTFAATANTSYLILVRHKHARPYVRLHLEGVDNPVAGVVPLRLNDQMGVGGSVDLEI